MKKNRISTRWMPPAFLALALLQSPSATAVDYTWLGSSTDWEDPLNWDFQGLPDGTNDTAVIAVNSDPRMGASRSVGAVTISGDGDLYTNGFQLFVNGGTHSGAITLETSVGASTLYIDDGAAAFDVDTDDLFVRADSLVDLRASGLQVDDFLDIDGGGRLSGDGTVQIFGNTNFLNDGIVQASGGTLTIERSGASTAIFDFDGSGAGTSLMEAQTNATLVLDMPVSQGDAYEGAITVGQNGEVQINSLWQLSGNATFGGFLNLNGGTGSATLSGSAWEMGGNGANSQINANTGTGVITGNLTMTNGTVTVATGATLQHDGTVTANAGTIANNALVVFNNTTTISTGVDFQMPGANASLTVGPGASVTINDENFNLDGGGFATNVLTINAGGTLDINHNDVGADDSVGMTINLEGGTLSVTNAADAVPWQINTASQVNANSGTSTINGDQLDLFCDDINVAAGATLNVTPSGGPTTSTTTNIDVGAGGLVAFSAGADYNGGTYTGAGTLRNNNSSIIVADTTIGIAIFDWDGTATGSSHTINDGVTLTINSPQIENGGTQNMNDPINLVGNGSSIVLNGLAEWIMGTNAINANTTQLGTVAIGGVSRFVLRSTLNVDGGTAINAPFTLDGGTVNIDTGFVLDTNPAAGSTILDGGTITGLGTWDGDDNTVVTDDTTIDVATIDYDGNTWTIEPDVTLTINVGDPDTVATNTLQNITNLNSGTMSFTTGDPVSVFSNCTINLNNTTGTIPTWTGEPINLGDDAGSLDADLNVDGTGVSQITSSITFKSDADVFIDSGTTLRTTTATFDSVNGANNAEFTGKGTWQLGGTNGGSNTVNEATTINMPGGTVDLDNSYVLGTPLFANDTNLNAPLTINAATMANYGHNGFAISANFSDLNIADLGSLTVTLDNSTAEWTVNSIGIVNYAGNASANTFLAGSDLNMNGNLNVTGDGRSNARLDIGGTITALTAAEPVRLNGGTIGDPNTLNGGTINGPGILGIDSGHALAGNGFINAEVQALGSAELIAANGLLDVNGAITDMGTLRSNGGAAVLDLALAFDSGVTQNGISLGGGRIQGATITLSTHNLRGNGLVTSQVINNNTIAAQGGLLRLTSGDWDGNGSPEVGVLRAQTGDLEIDAVSAGYNYDSTIQADSGREVFANGLALLLTSTSVVDLNGGALRSNQNTSFAGAINANSGTSALRIAGTASIQSSCTTTVTGNLRLENTNTNVASGATIAGGGVLINASGSTLTLADGFSLGVQLDNDGTLVLGTSPGQVSGTVFVQNAGGTLEIEIAGTNPADIDSLALSTSATLAGTLDLALAGGFTPTLGQTFTILTALSRTGEFDAIVQPPTMPAGLVFEAIYNPTNVQLEVVSASSYDDWIDSFTSLTDPADKTKTANPDDDEMNNLTEFAFDDDPTTGLVSGKIVVKIAPVGGTDVLTLTCPVRTGAVETGPAGGPLTLEQATDGVVYDVRATDDLLSGGLTVTEVTGADATAIQAGLPALSSPDWEYRTFRSPGPVAGDPREFMIVVISE